MKTLPWAAGLLLSLALLAGCGGGGGGGSDTPAGGDDPASAPTLVALGSSANTVSLAWRPVAGAGGYTVERKRATGAYTPVATLGADAIHFLDGDLEKNTTYTYRLGVAGTTQQAEQSATTSEDVAVVTAAVTPKGTPHVQSLGAGGGRINLADGTVAIDVPAGALEGDAELRLQPVTNTAPDGRGDGVHLHVAGTLARPLTLTLAYDAALDGQADGLGVALQRADGSWLSLPLLAVDKDKRTMTVRLDAHHVAPKATQSAGRAAAANVSLDFYVIAYLNFYLAPRTATVEVGKTRVLVPYAHTKGVIGTLCLPDEELGCLPMPLIGTQEVPFENSKAGYTRKWYVFAEEGGDAVSGTVTPRASVGATYKAPAEAPDVNPVVVSFVSVHNKSGRRVTLSSTITVKAPVWTGTLHGTLTAPGGTLGFTLTAEAVWTALPGSNGTRFVANGTQSLATIDLGCNGVVSPATVALPPGALEVDRSVEPARYTMDIGSIWRSAVTATCPGQGSTTVAFDVPARLVVEGTVSGDGTLIKGNTVQNTVAWDWAFTSEL